MDQQEPHEGHHKEMYGPVPEEEQLHAPLHAGGWLAGQVLYWKGPEGPSGQQWPWHNSGTLQQRRLRVPWAGVGRASSASEEMKRGSMSLLSGAQREDELTGANQTT